MSRLELPPCTPEQQETSNLFVKQMHALIERQGAMPFSEYMHRSLYEPELGYYVNGFSKLSVAGDFVTAPEISNDFALCIAKQCLQVIKALLADDVSAADILEFGGGSGRLAVDVLLALKKFDCLPERYLMLDVSPDLKQQQRLLLERLLPVDVVSRVHWVTEMPVGFNGVIIANEVLDAFAVERFRIESGIARRYMVTSAEFGFNLQTQADIETQTDVEAIILDIKAPLPEGYQSEYCPLLGPWWQSLSDSINQGAVIVCDYGMERNRYYSKQNSDGTLRCFYRHTVHDDPFARPAVQDITADVDFTAVTIAATDAGMELQGFSPLSQFMLSMGVLEHHQQKIEALDEIGQLAATGDLKRVILPQEMGDRFMVIGFSKGLDVALDGFSSADWSRLL